MLSDGRIVGRAEPFAKAFASSREVKRAVGATAWVILEDIALDATIDAQGRLVADTSVRQIADNLGLNKSTVARHLAWLRDYGFVLHEEARDAATGRWDTSRYILDPSTCVERSPTRQPPNSRPRHRLPSSTTTSGTRSGYDECPRWTSTMSCSSANDLTTNSTSPSTVTGRHRPSRLARIAVSAASARCTRCGTSKAPRAGAPGCRSRSRRGLVCVVQCSCCDLPVQIVATTGAGFIGARSPYSAWRSADVPVT